jgi:hypothetical protein
LAINQKLFDSGLLRIVISVLKQIHEVDVKFQLNRDESVQRSEANRFRSYLMRIVANLCFANVEAQNQAYDEGLHFLPIPHFNLKFT